MGTRQDAHRIIRDAEVSIRELIARAATEQRYGDVAALAETAAALASILKTNGDHVLAEPTSAKAAVSVGKRPKPKTLRRRLKDRYPRFESDGERLVKVGWSKKNREEYEHRAPKQAVIAVVRHLAENVSPGKVFVMEDLLPVHDRMDEDQEVPSYQVYLVFAWLRDSGVVQKHGRDGYEIVGKGIDENGVQELWEQLSPKRP